MRAVALFTIQNIMTNVTGTLTNKRIKVNKGLVSNCLSSQSPPNNEAKITNRVRNPTCPATAARVRLKIYWVRFLSGFSVSGWVIGRKILSRGGVNRQRICTKYVLKQRSCRALRPIKPRREQRAEQDNAHHEQKQRQGIRPGQRQRLLFFGRIILAIQVNVFQHRQIVVQADDRI